MLDNMSYERIRFGISAINPGLKGYKGKFVLAFNKRENKKEIMLYADAKAKEFGELIDRFKLPVKSVLGGGTMDEDDSNPRFPCAADAGIRLTTDSFFHKGEYFDYIPLELAATCLHAQYHTGIYINSNYTYMAITVAYPGSEERWVSYKHFISDIGFVERTTDFLVATGQGSSVLLKGPMAIQLFLAERGLLENSEKQIQQIIEALRKGVEKAAKEWLKPEEIVGHERVT